MRFRKPALSTLLVSASCAAPPVVYKDSWFTNAAGVSPGFVSYVDSPSDPAAADPAEEASVSSAPDATNQYTAPSSLLPLLQEPGVVFRYLPIPPAASRHGGLEERLDALRSRFCRYLNLIDFAADAGTEAGRTAFLTLVESTTGIPPDTATYRLSRSVTETSSLTYLHISGPNSESVDASFGGLVEIDYRRSNSVESLKKRLVRGILTIREHTITHHSAERFALEERNAKDVFTVDGRQERPYETFVFELGDLPPENTDCIQRLVNLPPVP